MTRTSTGRPQAVRSLKPAVGEDLVARRPPLIQPHPHDTVPDRGAAVPGAVLGDEDRAAVVRREHRARRRSACRGRPRARRACAPAGRTPRTGAARRTRGSATLARVAEREAEVQPGAVARLSSSARHVVPELVAAVVGEPELPGRRVPVEADGVAHPACEDLEAEPSGRMRMMRGEARVVLAGRRCRARRPARRACRRDRSG